MFRANDDIFIHTLIFIPTFTFPLTWINNFGKTLHPQPLPSLEILGNLFPYSWVTIFLKFCISPYTADILNWIYPPNLSS